MSFLNRISATGYSAKTYFMGKTLPFLLKLSDSELYFFFNFKKEDFLQGVMNSDFHNLNYRDCH